jgi:hypothetical protein
VSTVQGLQLPILLVGRLRRERFDLRPQSLGPLDDAPQACLALSRFRVQLQAGRSNVGGNQRRLA